jgi:hypothetical protein
VDEVQVDVEQVGFLVLALADQVLLPDLLRQRDPHGGSSWYPRMREASIAT